MFLCDVQLSTGTPHHGMSWVMRHRHGKHEPGLQNLILATPPGSEMAQNSFHGELPPKKLVPHPTPQHLLPSKGKWVLLLSGKPVVVGRVWAWEGQCQAGLCPAWGGGAPLPLSHGSLGVGR